jgi:hypothetical protein
MSLLVDFHMAAQDFLQLIAKKSKQASVNKEAEKEAETLHSFYEMVSSILSRAETDMQSIKMGSVVDKVKSKLLEKELVHTYNELYKVDSKIFAHIMSTVKTVLPSKAELQQDVIIKNKSNA